jgi:subtilisin family serine protease
MVRIATRLGRRSVVLCLLSIILGVLDPLIALADTIFLPMVRTDETPVSAASATHEVMVQLAPHADPLQFSHDYQSTVIGAIPSLALYHLQGVDPNLLANLSKDPRVKVVETMTPVIGFETHQKTYDARGGDFETLQRFFGYGGGDSADESFMVDKSKKKNKVGSKVVKDLAKFIDQALIANNDPVDPAWKFWGVQSMKLTKAAKYATGNNMVVAVLDTGVALDHPELSQRLVPGYDFVDKDAQPADLPNNLDDDEDGKKDEGTGHGTHVSGIISMVAPQAKIMPIRVLNSDGGGKLFDIVQGVVYAVAHGAQVINFSFSAAQDSPVFKAAIRYALDHQVVLVAAAAGTDEYLEYPAAYQGVLAVGAIRKGDSISDFSRPYAELVDVFAPGELIYSTYYNRGFAWWSGTSMAAPFISGEAALVLELLETNDCVPGCVYEMIMDEVEAVKPKLNGAGRANAEKALEKAKKYH